LFDAGFDVEEVDAFGEGVVGEDCAGDFGVGYSEE